MLQTLPTSSVDYTKVQSWMCKEGRGLRTKPLYPVLHRDKSLVSKLKDHGRREMACLRRVVVVVIICRRSISLGNYVDLLKS